MNDCDRLFTQSEVNRVFAHIPARTHYRWVQLGLAEYAGEHTDGRGTHRQYRKEHLWQIAMAEELMALNVGIPFARRVMRFLQSQSTDKWETRLDLWETCCMVIGKSREDLHKDHLMAEVFPEEFHWNWGLVVPSEDMGDFMRDHLEGSMTITSINLKSILIRVEGYLKRADL